MLVDPNDDPENADILAASHENFHAEVPEFMESSTHLHNFFLTHRRKYSRAYYHQQSKLDLLALHSDYFTRNVCSWLGQVRDVVIGELGPGTVPIPYHGFPPEGLADGAYNPPSFEFINLGQDEDSAPEESGDSGSGSQYDEDPEDSAAGTGSGDEDLQPLKSATNAIGGSATGDCEDDDNLPLKEGSYDADGDCEELSEGAVGSGDGGASGSEEGS